MDANATFEGPAPSATALRRVLRLGNRVAQSLISREFRRRYDADLDGTVYVDELGLEHDGGYAFYLGSLWLPTLLALRRARLGNDDVLADLGAGKGLVLLLAASLRIRRVVGVELSQRLADIARRNVERNRHRQRAQSVDVASVDALDWDIPDDLSVVYLYCPFWGEPFRAVMTRLFEAVERRSSPLRIIYNYPWEHNWLVSSGKVRVLDVAPAEWPWRPRWWMRSEVIVTYGVGQGPFPKPRGLRPSSAALARWSGCLLYTSPSPRDRS